MYKRHVIDKTDSAKDHSYQEIYVTVDEEKYSFEYYFMKNEKSATNAVSYTHLRLDIPEKFILLEAVVQIYGNKSGLPVMTVYNIRSESDNRKN